MIKRRSGIENLADLVQWLHFDQKAQYEHCNLPVAPDHITEVAICLHADAMGGMLYCGLNSKLKVRVR